MSNENEIESTNDDFKRIMESRFGKEAFRDDEGDKGEEVKQRPAPIDHDKAKEYVSEKVKQLPVEDEEDLGTNPADTLAGAMIEERFNGEEIERVREYRKSAESFRQTCLTLSRSEYNGRELSSAITSFQVARQFCGKIMQELGAEYPYPSKELADAVEADVDLLKEISDNGILTGLGIFRNQVQNLITEFLVYCEYAPVRSFLEGTLRTTVLQELIKGKMWLGEMIGVHNKN